MCFFFELFALYLNKLKSVKIMKHIEILSRILKFFGWIGIATGVILLIQSIIAHAFSLPSSLSVSRQLLSGSIYLVLAYSLTKKEIWAWYTSFAIFVLWFFFGIMIGFLLKFLVIISFSFIYIIFLWLLIKGKKPFVEQPTENFLEWFRSPYFTFVVVGALILYFISGVSVYLNSQKIKARPPMEAVKMKVQLPPESIKTRPVELDIYKNDKYNFTINYFTDKLALEKDYETERLANNPRLLFDAFFYDSNYGANRTGTKSIPVFTIEVFECKEKNMDVCLSPGQVTYGPQRYESGTFTGTGSGYIFDSTDASIDAQKLDITWQSHEEMRGLAVLKNQFLYIILGRTESKDFKPITQEVLDQTLSTFKFIKKDKITN
jgi:hypothetical protein